MPGFMNVLVVQNYDNTGLGQIERALDEAGAKVELIAAHRGDPLPADHSRHDALVVLGGAQNARDDEACPYLPELCGLMRGFADSDKAVLGVCLGSQLLARAFAADNLIGAAPEFGWREVELTPEGRSDPVLGGMPEAFPIFQWHDDTFTLPRGGTRLAGNAAAHNQAFRIRRAAYGIQFHFEADRALVERWNEDFAEFLAARQPQWREAHAASAARHGPAADAAGLAIARAWVAQIARVREPA